MTYAELCRNAAVDCGLADDPSGIDRAAHLCLLAEHIDAVTLLDCIALSDELNRRHGPKMDGPRDYLEIALLRASELIRILSAPLSDP